MNMRIGLLDRNRFDTHLEKSMNPITHMTFRRWVLDGLGSPLWLLQMLQDLGRIFY